jgi:hypothetical protein
VVPTYEELASRNRDLDAELRLLAERNRTLEALLKAEQDRAVHEREQREALAEKHSFTERVLADLKKNYALLQQEHELLRRRVFEAKAERIDSKQLELELEKTKTELDAMREQIEHATGTKLDDETDSPKTRTRNRPTGRRRLDPASLPTEEIVVTDPEMEALVAEGVAEITGSDDSTRMKRRRGCTICLVTKRITYRTRNADGSSETTLVTAAAPVEILGQLRFGRMVDEGRRAPRCRRVAAGRRRARDPRRDLRRALRSAPLSLHAVREPRPGSPPHALRQPPARGPFGGASTSARREGT